MTIKHLLARNKLWFWLALTWTLFIVIMCLKPSSGNDFISFPNADKVVHFCFYFGFITLWYRYLLLKNSYFLKNRYVLVAIAIVFGILIEIAQKIFTNSRQGDFWDVIANSLGALVGFFAVSKISKT